MIQANYVHMSKESSQAVYIEAEASLTEGTPIVRRVAPKLSVFAEIVSRHPSNKSRTVLFVEQEQVRMGPYIARSAKQRTEGHRSIQLLESVHTLSELVLAQRSRIGQSDLVHLLRQILASLGHSRGSAANECCRPFEIGNAMELCFRARKSA